VSHIITVVTVLFVEALYVFIIFVDNLENTSCGMFYSPDKVLRLVYFNA